MPRCDPLAQRTRTHAAAQGGWTGEELHPKTSVRGKNARQIPRFVDVFTLRTQAGSGAADSPPRKKTASRKTRGENLDAIRAHFPLREVRLREISAALRAVHCATRTLASPPRDSWPPSPVLNFCIAVASREFCGARGCRRVELRALCDKVPRTPPGLEGSNGTGIALCAADHPKFLSPPARSSG